MVLLATCRPHTLNIMEWLLGYRKSVNTFVNTTILDAHTFNIIVNPTDIDNIIERELIHIYRQHMGPLCKIRKAEKSIAHREDPLYEQDQKCSGLDINAVKVKQIRHTKPIVIFTNSLRWSNR